MANIDFPTSPANGQLFLPATGITYRYVTPPGIWTTVNGPVDTVIASDTPPSNPTPNQLWFNSALAMLYVYYDDGNSQQWVPSMPVPAPTAVGPTIQRLTTGSGLTYTTPAGVKWLRVRMAGGGSSSGTAGGTGPQIAGNTTFGSLTAQGGQGAAGGTATGGNVVNISGGTGGPGGGASTQNAGGGGGNPLGNPGNVVPHGGYAGNDATGYGAGGGGNSSGSVSASGGGGGGYVEHIYASPAATYTYTVGVAGAATGGGLGAPGIILVEEHY